MHPVRTREYEKFGVRAPPSDIPPKPVAEQEGFTRVVTSSFVEKYASITLLPILCPRVLPLMQKVSLSFVSTSGVLQIMYDARCSENPHRLESLLVSLPI